MWLEAIVSQDDFKAFAAELLPLTVHLGEAASGHYLSLSAPAEVSLIDGRGLRITCDAEVHWPVLGLGVPVHVQGLTVMLEPSVVASSSLTELDHDHTLLLGMQIEHADVAWVPAALDDKIVDAINVALRKKSGELSWHFARTLSHLFELPAVLQPLYGLDLKVAWGKARTTSEAMVLVVSFRAHALRQVEMERERAALERREMRHRLSDRALATRPQNHAGTSAALAVGAGLALLTTWLTIRGVYRRFSRPSSRLARAFA
jgi:hypothetical protein